MKHLNETFSLTKNIFWVFIFNVDRLVCVYVIVNISKYEKKKVYFEDYFALDHPSGIPFTCNGLN